MPWNWELPEWPEFTCLDEQLHELEKEFFIGIGSSFAYLKTIDTENCKRYIVEILSIEGLESAKIEGEILNRESLQSSIQQHFGLDPKTRVKSNKESGMAELLFDVYETFDQPLTHEMLWRWHRMLFKGDSYLSDVGEYRSHSEPMQIISNKIGSRKVFFEAPPSKRVRKEMDRFIKWFNFDSQNKSILVRAAITHLYFESIHPFEDGNGRIGRILVEKALSQRIEQPILIAISKILDSKKKDYYSQLQKCNYSLDARAWVNYFAKVILQAQEESMNLLYFIIQKSKMLQALSGQINSRQEKALVRMFEEGPNGFKGGLSAENYISITKCSRATASRDLTDLVQKEALIKSGELRYTRYELNLNQPI